MKREHLDAIAKQIMRDFPRSDLSVSSGRLFRSHLRRVGDEIGEPILPDEKDAPQYFVRVPVTLVDGDPVVVAISPEAAQKIIGRS